MLLHLILSEVSTGDSCFILFVCPCTMQYIKVRVCYIILVLYIFLINICTAIIVDVDTSELPVLLWKCLGYWKVITESMTPWKVPFICHLFLMIQIDLVVLTSFHLALMPWNPPDHTYFKVQKCRGWIYQINHDSFQQDYLMVKNFHHLTFHMCPLHGLLLQVQDHSHVWLAK